MRWAPERTRPKEELGWGRRVCRSSRMGWAVKPWHQEGCNQDAASTWGFSICIRSSVEKSGLEIKVQIAQLNVFLLFWTNEKTSLVNKSVCFVCCCFFFFFFARVNK